MKKMLGFLSAIGLIATTSIATISCNPTNRIIISKYNGLSSIKNEKI
ncbi:lipoprotein [Vibrio harveyi]|nr:lipoprotein [Vibrio harveyi]